MKKFLCPYLESEVEFPLEREQHIIETHPELLPAYESELALTLQQPDKVRYSRFTSSARLFYRWFDSVRNGKYIVVVVVTDSSFLQRHWIVTAYIARKIPKGD